MAPTVEFSPASMPSSSPGVRKAPEHHLNHHLDSDTDEYSLIFARDAPLEFSQGDMPRLRRRMAAEVVENAFAEL